MHDVSVITLHDMSVITLHDMSVNTLHGVSVVTLHGVSVITLHDMYVVLGGVVWYPMRERISSYSPMQHVPRRQVFLHHQEVRGQVLRHRRPSLPHLRRPPLRLHGHLLLLPAVRQ